MWWPAGLSQQLHELVQNCKTCIKERSNPTEPLITTDFPERPWQRLGADLFALKAKTYLRLVDYYLRYVEIAHLSLTKSADITAHLKSMFARHGMPETLITDNGPPFSGSVFSALAMTYGFSHVTSSPRFLQSNGGAERAVQTVKNPKGTCPFAIQSHSSSEWPQRSSTADGTPTEDYSVSPSITPATVSPQQCCRRSEREREEECRLEEIQPTPPGS